VECVSKERRVVFILSDEIHRYIGYVAGVYVFLEREREQYIVIVTCFLMFDKDNVRVLAASSLSVFLERCGLPEKGKTKGIYPSWVNDRKPIASVLSWSVSYRVCALVLTQIVLDAPIERPIRAMDLAQMAP
jgi:hypothetical protein